MQHIALRTENIIESIERMQVRGCQFLTIPDSYYENLKERLASSATKVAEDIEALKRLNILVDFDEKGYLL